METLEPLNKSELIQLSNMIDRLDNEITLQEKTMSDLRLSISELRYKRNRPVNIPFNPK